VNRLPITVAMIAGAEASRIGRALESVAEWAGEIIVVLNADVNDGTDEIAARHGAKVFREPWKGFRDQKNSAAQKASHDWILSLDADEVVSPELRKEIEEAIRETGCVAFDMPRLSWCCGRWVRTATGIPTARSDSGAKARRNGVGEASMRSSSSTGRLAICAATCCTSAWTASTAISRGSASTATVSRKTGSRKDASPAFWI
jgi:glycosyltransferase involved in cell wall biosynthesis